MEIGFTLKYTVSECILKIHGGFFLSKKTTSGDIDSV